MPVPEANKKYTFADYLAFPDDERWEILEGVPYMQAAPSWQHQDILRELLLQFGNYLSGKTCKAFASPFDLRLQVAGEENDEDIINVFQPDLTVICDKSKLKGSGYLGVPELIIEISSPSTGKLDKLLKFNVYEKAGVPEYWIVEPDTKIISVFKLENGRYGRPEVYAEDDNIPVGIFPDLAVDLKQVFEGI